MALFTNGKAILLASELLLRELEDAPPEVQEVLSSVPLACIERVDMTDEAVRLQELYLAAGVVAPSQANDAMHVALAVVSRADMIVS